MKIYYDQEKYVQDGSWHLGYDKACELRVKDRLASETIILDEGYVFFVEEDVIMKKGSGGAKLEFD